MSNHSYITSLEEENRSREATLLCESERLKTFDSWTVPFIDKRTLAAAGFYYLNHEADVKCVFCGVQIGNWEENDDPWECHRRYSPACGYIRRMPVGNVPLDPSNPPIVPYADPSQGYDTCGPYGFEIHERNRNLNNAIWPNYSLYDERLRSYDGWPLAIRQRPHVLSEAGFFYTSKGDQTICFQCGGGLKDWEEGDDPWVEHASWFPHCPYLLSIKGKYFVDLITKNKKLKREREISGPCDGQENSKKDDTSSTATTSECDPSTSSQAVNSESKGKIDESHLCKICFVERIGIVFLPCGHMVACPKCAPSLNFCAVCRKPFTATVRAIL